MQAPPAADPYENFKQCLITAGVIAEGSPEEARFDDVLKIAKGLPNDTEYRNKIVDATAIYGAIHTTDASGA